MAWGEGTLWHWMAKTCDGTQSSALACGSSAELHTGVGRGHLWGKKGVRGMRLTLYSPLGLNLFFFKSLFSIGG